MPIPQEYYTEYQRKWRKKKVGVWKASDPNYYRDWQRANRDHWNEYSRDYRKENYEKRRVIELRYQARVRALNEFADLFLQHINDETTTTNE